MPELLVTTRKSLVELHSLLKQNTTGQQRRWGLMALAALVAVMAVTLVVSSRVNWRVLDSNLDAKDAQEAVVELSAAKIPYQLEADGTLIRVPAEQVDKARLSLAAKGLPRSGRMGFELFDKPNWIGSEFDEKVNYERALEGELEHTIGTMGSVESARVHLVLPHESLFQNTERAAKASVILKLNRRSLSDTESDSIRTLVASAVDGLDPEHVTLVDAAGRLSFGPKDAFSENALLEQTLADRVLATIEPLTGRENLRATVNVESDSSSQEETQESYDPNGTVMLSMQRSEENTGGEARPAGIPGAASNAPNSGGATQGPVQPNPLPLFPPTGGTGANSRQESGNYAASKRVRHRIDRPGRLRRLTVAVLVNDQLTWQGSGKDAHQVFAPRRAEDMTRIEALARAAVGFDTARGDTIAVENVSFAGNTIPHTPTLIERFTPARSQVSQFSMLALPAAMFLLVFFLLVRPAGLQMVRAMRGAPAGAQAKAEPLPAQTLLTAEPPGESGGERAIAEPAFVPPRRMQNPVHEMRASLARSIEEDSAPAVRLLKTWINADDDAVEV